MNTDLFSQTVHDCPIDRLDHEDPIPYLLVLEGVDKGKAFALTQGANIFGRNLESPITLRDEKMSRSHGIFHLDGAIVTCEDLRSTNGTFVDGVSVQVSVLTPNSRVRIGGTLMKIATMTEDEKDALCNTEHAATRDPLTGVYNRNGFEARLKIDLSKTAVIEDDISLLLLDIDFFKKLNDELGHAAGDAALQIFSKRVASQLRAADSLMRYGGEEFVVLLLNTSEEIALSVAERIRMAIEAPAFNLEGIQREVSVSIGIYTATPDDNRGVESAIKNADKALYKAKELGRNRCEKYTK